MLIYFILYFLIGLFIVLFDLLCNNEEYKNKYVNLSIFILLFMLFALRHQSMGIDLHYLSDYGYLGSFEKLSSYSWKEIITLESHQNYEKGYILLNKLIGSISTNRQFFIAVIAFLSLLPISIFIRKKSTTPAFSYIIYIGIPSFLLLFSGLRQDLAIGICALSYIFIEDKKPIKFIITVLIASLFHVSALVFLVAYPLYHLKINNTLRVASIGMIGVVYLLRYPIFNIISTMFNKDFDADYNNSYVLLAVLSLVYMFGVALGNRSERQNGYMNIFYVACVCQVFGSISSMVTRAGYYFLLALIILLPSLVEDVKDVQTREVMKTVTIYCFIAFGLFNLYTSSWAMANPYIFFWK